MDVEGQPRLFRVEDYRVNSLKRNPIKLFFELTRSENESVLMAAKLGGVAIDREIKLQEVAPGQTTIDALE